jgi:hypothetical protein
MFSVSSSGSFDKTKKFLEFMKAGKPYKNLDQYGHKGVDALASATPVDTGRAAQSWGFQTGLTNSKYSLSWFNTDREGGAEVVLLIQYGHGTGTGGYVPPRDFINPAITPIFDAATDDVWKQVRNA